MRENEKGTWGPVYVRFCRRGRQGEREGFGGGNMGTGTARTVHAQPPGRAHLVCIRVLSTS